MSNCTQPNNDQLLEQWKLGRPLRKWMMRVYAWRATALVKQSTRILTGLLRARRLLFLPCRKEQQHNFICCQKSCSYDNLWCVDDSNTVNYSECGKIPFHTLVWVAQLERKERQTNHVAAVHGCVYVLWTCVLDVMWVSFTMRNKYLSGSFSFLPFCDGVEWAVLYPHVPLQIRLFFLIHEALLVAWHRTLH